MDKTFIEQYMADGNRSNPIGQGSDWVYHGKCCSLFYVEWLENKLKEALSNAPENTSYNSN